MAKRVLMAALLALGLVGVSAASAGAATTVGATGTPGDVLGSTLEFASLQPAIPASGKVTSLNTQSGTCAHAHGEYDLQVLAPKGGDLYEVVGDSGNHADRCDGALHSYAVKITVIAGDVLGVYVIAEWEGVLSFGVGNVLVNEISEPTVGQTFSLPFSEGLPPQIDESATLVTLPTAIQQCMKNGWKNFGTRFKNQGQCIKFVETGR